MIKSCLILELECSEFLLLRICVFSELAGLFGGAIVLDTMGVPTPVFWSHVISTTTVFLILLGLAKSMLFGLMVAMIACSAGMRTKSTADGVGNAATRAVVNSIVAIAVSDGILAVLSYIWGF